MQRMVDATSIRLGCGFFLGILGGSFFFQSALLAGDFPTLQELPDGEAKVLLSAACAGCHPLSTTLNVRKTRDDWESTVNDMLSRGAQIFPDEIDTLIDYLSIYLGPQVK